MTGVDRRWTKPVLVASHVVLTYVLVGFVVALLWRNIDKDVPLVESCTVVEVKRSGT